MSSLLERMMKTGELKGRVALLSESEFFNKKDFTQTGYPSIDIAFSGAVEGGLTSGLTVLAGESKSFKTLLGLVCMKAYLDKHKDGLAILYDSEFGITPAYLKSIGIPTDRVLHIPIMNIEELKFDMTQRLKEIKKSDNVYILIDSLGNLASLKEATDAEDGKSVQDMSRAKQIKSFFRIITPHFTLKDIPCIVINHVYDSQGCLDGDTMIKTSEGSKKIKDIKIGDFVFGTTGPQKVLDIMTPLDLSSDDKDFYELEFDDGSIIRCTGNHKFLQRNGDWVETKDMKIGTLFK